MTGNAVVLASMPMAGVERPSLALGLLKAILAQGGIETTTVYPNMWFLEFVGVADYYLLETCAPEEALVEWLFADAAFPDARTDYDTFLHFYFQRNPHHSGRKQELTRTFLRLRSQMRDFVEWTVDRILALEPVMVGCTSTFSQHVPSLALLRRIRERAPHIVTMLGGANCESVMGRTTHTRFEWVDYVCSGEADALIAPLCRDILARGRDIPAAELPFGVFGPAHRIEGYPVTSSGDGTPRAVADDLRSLPLPDYSDYFAEWRSMIFAGQIYPGLPMEFSRGCWWGERSHCTFCGLNGGSMSYRQKPGEQAAADMIELSARYGLPRIEAVDNILAIDYFDKALPILAAQDRKLSIFFEVKANLKRHEVEKLSAAGIRWIQPGIETLNTPLLKMMGKGTTAAHNVLLLKWCRQNGVRVSWSVLWGFPGEDDAWYSGMAPWFENLHHLQPGNLVRLRYQRYSPYHQRPERYGLELVPSAPFRHVYPLEQQELADLVYYFDDVSEGDVGGQRSAQSVGGRPGLDAVIRARQSWLAAWRQTPPELTMRHDGDALLVEDTRQVSVARHQRIEGLPREILLAADEGIPETRACERFEQAGHDRPAIEAAIAELCDARLMLRLDGRLVGLPLWDPYIPLLPLSAFPGGHFTRSEQQLLVS